jgi:GTPase SAR1 family protein
MESFKFAIMGDQNVGKSEYISLFFDDNSCVFETSHGLINIELIEVYNQLPNDINGVVVMMDLVNLKSFENLSHHIEKAKKVTNNIVLCGNKVDVKGRVVKWKNHINKMTFGLKYFEISCITGRLYDYPIQYLLQNIKGQDFKFIKPNIEMPCLANVLTEYNLSQI